jgi:tartrate dehydrogenase/decarboxylase/D-malate dehydrogenase
MKTHNIAVYAGDGIGIEVTAEVARVLATLEDVFDDVRYEWTEFDWGHRHWAKTGKVVPDDYLATVREFDAIFLGAVGDPAHVPDHITLVPLIEMRQRFDQYVCLRPARLLPGVKSPLADKGEGDIDMMIVRENSEGEYVNNGGIFKPGEPGECAMQNGLHTRFGIERIIRYAFELAGKRRNHLTLATKSNAQKFSMVLWDKIFAEVEEEYPAITADKFHVDALAMNFVRCPENYDVVVGSNLFGDILSDLGGAIVGSLGVTPSSNINPERRFPSLFEPVHGSAPDIADQGIANPVAAILSAAMMIEFLGETEAAQLVEDSVVASLRDGKVRTPDLGGSSSTTDVTADILQRITG